LRNSRSAWRWLGGISVGHVSLRQHEWNCRDTKQQNQIKCTSKQIGFNGRTNLFFHIAVLCSKTGPDVAHALSNRCHEYEHWYRLPRTTVARRALNCVKP